MSIRASLAKVLALAVAIAVGTVSGVVVAEAAGKQQPPPSSIYFAETPIDPSQSEDSAVMCPTGMRAQRDPGAGRSRQIAVPIGAGRTRLDHVSGPLHNFSFWQSAILSTRRNANF